MPCINVMTRMMIMIMIKIIIIITSLFKVTKLLCSIHQFHIPFAFKSHLE